MPTAPWDLPDDLWARVLRLCFARGAPGLDDSEALEARWTRRLAACSAHTDADTTWRAHDFPREPPPGWSSARWRAFRDRRIGASVEPPHSHWRRDREPLAWKQDRLANEVANESHEDWCAALRAAAPDDADPWFRRHDFPPFPPPGWSGVEYAHLCAVQVGQPVTRGRDPAGRARLRAAGFLGEKHYRIDRMATY